MARNHDQQQAAYFPQVGTVISLPTAEDELTKLVETIVDELKDVKSPDDVAMAKRFNSKVRAALESYPDDEIFARLVRIREGAVAESVGSAKPAEFDVFASGRAEIGPNSPTAKLYAQTLPREIWLDPDTELDLSAIKNVVAVHRLRAVSCLYGFTRFEAAPTTPCVRNWPRRPSTDYAKRMTLKCSKVLTCSQRLCIALQRVHRAGALCTTLRAAKLCWTRMTSC
jgi:hypothetical protein